MSTVGQDGRYIGNGTSISDIMNQNSGSGQGTPTDLYPPAQNILNEHPEVYAQQDMYRQQQEEMYRPQPGMGQMNARPPAPQAPPQQGHIPMHMGQDNQQQQQQQMQRQMPPQYQQQEIIYDNAAFYPSDGAPDINFTNLAILVFLFIVMASPTIITLEKNILPRSLYNPSGCPPLSLVIFNALLFGIIYILILHFMN